MATGSESQDHLSTEGEESLQGQTFVPDSREALEAALEQAFDYRGDVTLGLKDGRQIIGYLFNRDFRSAAPGVDLIPADGNPRLRVTCEQIHFVRFSGRDMASGRSWEAWVKRWNDKQSALAEGRDIGDIEPKATHL